MAKKGCSVVIFYCLLFIWIPFLLQGMSAMSTDIHGKSNTKKRQWESPSDTLEHQETKRSRYQSVPTVDPSESLKTKMAKLAREKGQKIDLVKSDFVPPLKHTPISYRNPGKGKEKETPRTKDASPAPPPPRVSFDVEGILARARQLLLEKSTPTFGSSSSSSISGETIEVAKKNLLEFLQQDLSSVLPHQAAVGSAISTLLSSGVASFYGLDLAHMDDLNLIFIGYKMAQDDLVETKDYFSVADQMKSELSSALSTADQVMRVIVEAQEALTTVKATVEELKVLMKAALENQHQCQQRAEDSVSTLHDTGYQVDKLSKKFESHGSRRPVMQTIKIEAEVLHQMVEAKWNAIKASLNVSSSDQTPLALQEKRALTENNFCRDKKGFAGKEFSQQKNFASKCVGLSPSPLSYSDEHKNFTWK